MHIKKGEEGLASGRREEGFQPSDGSRRILRSTNSRRCVGRRAERRKRTSGDFPTWQRA